MKQVLILTDSIGAPRSKPLKTYYKDTWIGVLEEKLLKHNYKTFAYTQRAADSSHIKSRIEVQFGLYEPEIVILQIGICDCAPRVLKQNELRIIKRLPIINKLVHSYISNNY